MNQIVPIQPSNAEVYRASTDAADLCRAIVLQTAMEIQQRRYVKVEGWQAIAIAHGCTGSACGVEAVDGGVRAIGEIRRMSDGALIAQAEGFVGEDEPTWFGGEMEADEWTGPKGNRRKTGQKIIKVLPKRPDYAIRAMAQTRAISRACRSAFAHVVVMIDAGLSTTPAEEVPHGGFHDEPMRDVTPVAGGDDPFTTAGPSLAVTASQTAITLAESCDQLKAWHSENMPMISTLSGEDQDAIAVSYKSRWRALKETAPKAQPQSVYDELNDEIPF